MSWTWPSARLLRLCAHILFWIAWLPLRLRRAHAIELTCGTRGGLAMGSCELSLAAAWVLSHGIAALLSTSFIQH